MKEGINQRLLYGAQGRTSTANF